MAQLNFRPTLVPTIFTVPALIVLIGLGAWQLQRLEWKAALIAEREARLAEPPIALTDVTASEAAKFSYRRAKVAGRFLHDKELILGARAHQQISGVELLTPLELDDGRIVMVNRGWVPLEVKDPAARPGTLTAGRVDITGIVRLPRATGGWFTPENDIAAKHWFFYDVDGMARHLNLPLVPLVIEASIGADATALPIGREATVARTNNHLQYAITWFALALALAVIYVVYHKQRDQN